MMFYEKTHNLFIFQSRPISYSIQKYGGSNDITILRRVDVRLTPVGSSKVWFLIFSCIQLSTFRSFGREEEKGRKRNSVENNSEKIVDTEDR